MEIFSFFGKIVTNSAEAEREIKGVTNTAKDSEDKMTKAFSNIGKAIFAAFSVKAIIDFGQKLIGASANIQAMESQFDQVFKTDKAKAVEGIAAQVDQLGIHADRLTVSWNKFGGQVKGAGMDGQQALDAVSKATSLAADSAAFYDTSLENSSASLASFMKGNFEAGDAIGVFTNAKQMDVQSNETYGKSWADLTEAERQWLLLDTVEKTYEMNGAMGQASREAGAYENVMGNLKATFERFFAVVGEPVLEVFLGVVEKVTDGVILLTEKAQDANINFDKFKEIIQLVKDNMDIILPVLAGVTAAITAHLIINTVKAGYDAFKVSTIATAIAQGNLNIVLAANPFGVVAIAIGLLVTAGILLYKNWDTVKEKATELFNKVKETFDNIKANVTETITKLVTDTIQWGKDMVSGLWNGIAEKAQWLKDRVSGFIEGIKNVFTRKEGFDMHSPSRLMITFGLNIVQGLAMGITDNESIPLNAMQTLGAKMVAAARSAVDSTFAILSNAQMGQMTKDLKTIQDIEDDKTEKRLRKDLGDKKYDDLYSQGVDDNGLYTNSKVGVRELILESMSNYTKQGGNIDDWEKTEHGQFWTDDKYTDRYKIRDDEFDAMKNQAKITQNITINSPKSLSASESAKEAAKATVKLVLPLLR